MSGGGAESAWEAEKRSEREVKAEVSADPFVRAVLEAFPGAELTIRQTAAPVVETPTEVEDEE